MEQKQTPVDHKSTKTLFLDRADLGFLYHLLKEVLQKRSVLVGMEETHVKGCMRVYLSGVLLSPLTYGDIRRSLSSGTDVRKFITSSLLPTFIDYLLKYTDDDITTLLKREIAAAAKQKVCRLLARQFDSYKEQALKLLTEYAAVDHLESEQLEPVRRNLIQQWDSTIKSTMDNMGLIEKLTKNELPASLLTVVFMFFCLVIFEQLFKNYIAYPFVDKFTIRTTPKRLAEKSKELSDQDSYSSDISDSMRNVSIALIFFVLLCRMAGRKLDEIFFGPDDIRLDTLLQQASADYTAKHAATVSPTSLLGPILAAGNVRPKVVFPEEPPKSETKKRWRFPSTADDNATESPPKEKKYTTPPANIENRGKKVTYIPIALGQKTNRFFKVDRPKLTKLFQDEYPREKPDDFIASVVNKVEQKRAVDKVGKGEGKLYGTNHKLRLDNIAHNSHRLAVQSRKSNKDEEALGVIGEVESPKKIVIH